MAELEVKCGSCEKRAPAKRGYSDKLYAPDGWIQVQLGDYTDLACDWDCADTVSSRMAIRGKVAGKQLRGPAV